MVVAFLPFLIIAPKFKFLTSKTASFVVTKATALPFSDTEHGDAFKIAYSAHMHAKSHPGAKNGIRPIKCEGQG
jgi:hypothetical protein